VELKIVPARQGRAVNREPRLRQRSGMTPEPLLCGRAATTTSLAKTEVDEPGHRDLPDDKDPDRRNGANREPYDQWAYRYQ
jgi:hypothetical protein